MDKYEKATYIGSLPLWEWKTLDNVISDSLCALQCSYAQQANNR